MKKLYLKNYSEYIVIKMTLKLYPSLKVMLQPSRAPNVPCETAVCYFPIPKTSLHSANQRTNMVRNFAEYNIYSA